MRSYFFRSPSWLQLLYPGLIWKVNTPQKELYLTFDDGPDPVATPYVLDLLKAYSARATFFCLGKNIRKHPAQFQKIVEEGHTIGNHTFYHSDGWRSRNGDYIKDVKLGEREIEAANQQANLFRPPYGRIKKGQISCLRQDYRLVMWSHLSGDFDKNLHLKASQKALLGAERGSIFLFHDSFAAYRNMKVLLPLVLSHFTESGYKFKSLSDDAIS